MTPGYQNLFELVGLWLPQSPLIPRKGCERNITLHTKHRESLHINDKCVRDLSIKDTKRKGQVV